MSSGWPALSYEAGSETCDTLHAHTQILGKLAVKLAPPEPQLQHTALGLTARGWETPTMPAPDGSGAIIAALDLRTHEATIEHSDGREARIPLTPHRPVAEVTRDVLGEVGRLAGAVEINPTPQEVPWTVPLDEDFEHARYESDQVESYFTAATYAALALEEFVRRIAAPRRRSMPGGERSTWRRRSSRGSRSIHRRTTSSCVTRGTPSRSRSAGGRATRSTRTRPSSPVSTARWLLGCRGRPAAAHWHPELGEFVLEWEDIRAEPDPGGLALEFAHAVFQHGCLVCDWDPELAGSAKGTPPPVH
jgi:hypothetical protein